MEVWLPVETASELLVSNLGCIKNNKEISLSLIISTASMRNRANNLEWITPKEKYFGILVVVVLENCINLNTDGGWCWMYSHIGKDPDEEWRA
ncbi:16937_t:CDS:2 [Funneliformis caledonium]|uniref:16937_t:CDS:1 n=1 Tax=Funneliformis caledonium TaxID=1117310 RepID=A0A9N8YZN4_9GLOM|nr:16937_t:CDS:2 [Funneliformis caledonium]